MNKWIIIEVLTNLFEASIIFKFLKDSLKLKKDSKLINCFIIIIQSVTLLIFNSIFNHGNILTVILMTLSWYISSYFIFEKEKWYKPLFFIASILFIIILCELVTTLLISSIIKVPHYLFFQEGSVIRISAIIISKTLLYIIFKNINFAKDKKGIKERIQIYNMGIMFFLNIILIFVLKNIYKQVDYNNTKFILNIGAVWIIICLLDIFIIYIINTLCKYVENVIDMEIQKNYYESQKNHIEQINKIILDIRKIQHDYNNHLAVIYAYLNSGQHDALEEYVKELVGDVKKITPKLKTCSSPIESIILFKKSIAEEKGIQVFFDNHIGDTQKINAQDVSGILFNLLDNAIEACEKINNREKYIKLYVEINDNFLQLKIENSSDGEYNTKNKTFITSKKDKKQHGFGLQNIKFIVEEKNDGLLDINPEKERFVIRISSHIN